MSKDTKDKLYNVTVTYSEPSYSTLTVPAAGDEEARQLAREIMQAFRDVKIADSYCLDDVPALKEYKEAVLDARQNEPPLRQGDNVIPFKKKDLN